MIQISSFGERVKYLLKKNDMSQQDLASILGITTARLNNYLNDKTEAGYSILSMIARTLGTTADYLLGRSLNFNSVHAMHSRDVVPFRVFHDGGIDSDEELHFMLVPVYISGSADPVSFAKVAVSDSAKFSGAYCVKVTDNSMAPLLCAGDFVYIAPLGRCVSRKDMLDPSVIYAVRLSESDVTGVSLRYCLKKDDTVFLRPSDNSYETVVLDIGRCGFNVVAGNVLGMSRVYSAD